MTGRLRGQETGCVTVEGIDGLRSLEGRELGPGDWMAINQDRVNTFAYASGDDQWIHVDVDRAGAGPFGSTIAHGYLTLSLVIPMLAGLLDVVGVRMGVNYGLDKVRFPTPVPVGSRVRLRAVVSDVSRVDGDGVQVVLDLTVEVEGGTKPACVARTIYRYYG